MTSEGPGAQVVQVRFHFICCSSWLGCMFCLLGDFGRWCLLRRLCFGFFWHGFGQSSTSSHLFHLALCLLLLFFKMRFSGLFLASWVTTSASTDSSSDSAVVWGFVCVLVFRSFQFVLVLSVIVCAPFLGPNRCPLLACRNSFNLSISHSSIQRDGLYASFVLCSGAVSACLCSFWFYLCPFARGILFGRVPGICLFLNLVFCGYCLTSVWSILPLRLRCVHLWVFTLLWFQVLHLFCHI